MATVSIYNYLNYRDYLRDFYNYNKGIDPRFSYRYFLNKAGIQSPIYYQQVILGKRNLTPATQQKFVNALDLNKDESGYFKVLCDFNHAKTNKAKQEAYKYILKFGHFLSPEVLGEKYFTLYQNWYTEAVRELICMQQFETWAALGRSLKPSITAKQAENSVNQLLKLNLIQKQNDTYSLTDTIITTGHEVASMVVRKHNKDMLTLAEESLETDQVSIRNIQGMTMGISKNAYSKIEEEIEHLYQRIAIIIDNDTESDRVYHLNTTLFPLSKFKAEE